MADGVARQGGDRHGVDRRRDRWLRLAVIAVTTLAVLAVFNLQVMQKEAIVAHGDTVLLRLAPRDPRALLQGDYMALRYAMVSEVARAAAAAGVDDGRVVVTVVGDDVAAFAGLYEGGDLDAGHHLLRFHRRGETLRLASDAFFFEEGDWGAYSDAAFGELRVDDAGDAVLIGLRDAARRPLGQRLH